MVGVAHGSPLQCDLGYNKDMAVAPPEPPPQPPRPTNRLARASLNLVGISAAVLAIWVIAALTVSLGEAGTPASAFRHLVWYTWGLALILRGLPIYLMLLANLGGLITGIMALARIKKRGGTEEGDIFATTGTLLSLMGLIVTVLGGGAIAFYWMMWAAMMN